MNSLNGKNRGKIGNVKTKQKKGKNKIMHKIKIKNYKGEIMQTQKWKNHKKNICSQKIIRKSETTGKGPKKQKNQQKKKQGMKKMNSKSEGKCINRKVQTQENKVNTKNGKY